MEIVPIVFAWIVLCALAFGTVCFQVERKNRNRISTDKTGVFGSESILTFYADRLKMETPVVQGTSTLQYNQFYQVLESKQYFMFYFNKNMVSLLRKKDMTDIDPFREFIKEKFAKKYRVLWYKP